MKDMFTEEVLGEEIIKTWGEFGVHYEVFKMMLDKIDELQSDDLKEKFHYFYHIGGIDGIFNSVGGDRVGFENRYKEFIKL